MKKTEPQRYKVRVYEPRIEGLTAEAWSYRNPKSFDVYIRLLKDGTHFVGTNIRLRLEKDDDRAT